MATTITMPQLGETITEGTILSWAKQPGDTVAEDDVLFEISTDKVDTEVPSPVAGVIQEILVAEGETVSVGTPLVVIVSHEEAAAGVVVPTAAPEPAADSAPVPDQAPEPEPATHPEPALQPVGAVPAAAASPPLEVPQGTGDAPKRGLLSPVVRKLAAENNVDLSLVAGSGDGGRITRKDISRYIDSQRVAATPPPPPAVPTAEVTFEPVSTAAAAPTPPAAPTSTQPEEPAMEPATAATVSVEETSAAVAAAGDRVEQMPRLRKVIAENMIKAKLTSAHVWTSVEVDYEGVERVRQKHKSAWKAREGSSLTYMPFIARATIDALSAYPVVNSSFDLENGTQTFHSAVGLGIAVDLSEGGLVVMNMPGADGLALTGLARGIRAVAEKARAGKLELDDLSGSTFTITNPGPFGSFMSAPIINVPNVAILSTDTVTKRPTVITLPDGSDAIVIRHIGYLGLTWDHRVFDGSTAVLFLRRIKENLETWDWDQELA